MLQTLKKFYKFKKPFYGINSGNYGFDQITFEILEMLDLGKWPKLLILDLAKAFKTRIGQSF